MSSGVDGMSRLITVEVEGVALTHIHSVRGPDHVTLCGEDGDDPVLDMRTVQTPKDAKVNCRQCINTWLDARRIRKSQLDPRLLWEVTQ